jgi:cytoskeletal protein RodZ
MKKNQIKWVAALTACLVGFVFCLANMTDTQAQTGEEDTTCATTTTLPATTTTLPATETTKPATTTTLPATTPFTIFVPTTTARPSISVPTTTATQPTTTTQATTTTSQTTTTQGATTTTAKPTTTTDTTVLHPFFTENGESHLPNTGKQPNPGALFCAVLFGSATLYCAWQLLCARRPKRAGHRHNFPASE